MADPSLDDRHLRRDRRRCGTRSLLTSLTPRRTQQALQPRHGPPSRPPRPSNQQRNDHHVRVPEPLLPVAGRLQSGLGVSGVRPSSQSGQNLFGQRRQRAMMTALVVVSEARRRTFVAGARAAWLGWVLPDGLAGFVYDGGAPRPWRSSGPVAEFRPTVCGDRHVRIWGGSGGPTSPGHHGVLGVKPHQRPGTSAPEPDSSPRRRAGEVRHVVPPFHDAPSCPPFPPHPHRRPAGWCGRRGVVRDAGVRRPGW